MPEKVTPAENNTLVFSPNRVKKEGCQPRCGDLVVPYPFGIGIGSGCSLNPQFEINCDTTFHPPKAFIPSISKHAISNITDSRVRISNLSAQRCYNPNGSVDSDVRAYIDLKKTPYTISDINALTVVGCGVFGWVTASNSLRNLSTGCLPICLEQEDVRKGECLGGGCCQTAIAENLISYNARVGTLKTSDDNSSTVGFAVPCIRAFLGDPGTFGFKGLSDLHDNAFVDTIQTRVPLVLEWAIGNLSCLEAQKSKDDYACQPNSECVNRGEDDSAGGGYRCICKSGYQGNPYHHPSGCQDINECEDKQKYQCNGVCKNFAGGYECQQHSTSFPVLRFSLGISFGFLAILCSVLLLYFTIKKRKLILLREKFFEQNGGLLLTEKLIAEGGSNLMTFFTVGELKEATNNYADDRILGQGGFGTVYKGILQENRVVAIKKSQKVDQGQREQFINEMAILTQVNHRNVVKLLGCCLETEVPLLVYEFVPNDTLFHHIDTKTLSWNSRLRIACESASALAYLHSAASIPIIHRDVKSSNILLDDNYTPKIADFGASRLVPLIDDQVATLIQGTLGYLDPEYLHTGQLTDKSDVYSFGVVLAELLTGEKPLDGERFQEQQNLVMYFVSSMKEDRLFEILEPQVAKEAAIEQLKAIGELVKRCLNLVGDNRPKMKEVAMELETLKKHSKHPLALNQDGYTVESGVMIEVEQTELNTDPLIPFSNTFREYSSSSTQMDDLGILVHSPR